LTVGFLLSGHAQAEISAALTFTQFTLQGQHTAALILTHRFIHGIRLQTDVAAVSARLLAGAGRGAPIYGTPQVGDTLRSATAQGSSGRSWWEASSFSITGAGLEFIPEIAPWSSGAIPQRKPPFSLVKHTQAPRFFGSAANVSVKAPLHAGSRPRHSPRRPPRSSLHSTGGGGSASTLARVLTDGGRPGPSSAPAVHNFLLFSTLWSIAHSRGTTKMLPFRSSVTVEAVGGAAGEAAGAAPVPAPARGAESPPPNGGCGRASSSGVAERPSVSLPTSTGTFTSEDGAVETMCGAGAGAMPRAAATTTEAACCAWRTLLFLAVPTASIDAPGYAARVREEREEKLAVAMAKVLGITDSVSVTVVSPVQVGSGHCATPLPLPDLLAALCCWKLGEGVWTWRTVEDGVATLAIALECAAGDDSASDDVAARKERALSVIAECATALGCVALPLMEVRLTLLGLPGLGERLEIHQPAPEPGTTIWGAACNSMQSKVSDLDLVGNAGKPITFIDSALRAKEESGVSSIGAYVRGSGDRTFVLSAGHNLYAPRSFTPRSMPTSKAGSGSPQQVTFIARMDPCLNYSSDPSGETFAAFNDPDPPLGPDGLAIADVAVYELPAETQADTLTPLHVGHERMIDDGQNSSQLIPDFGAYSGRVHFFGINSIGWGSSRPQPQALDVIGYARRYLHRYGVERQVSELLYIARPPSWWWDRFPQPGDSGGAVLNAKKQLHSFVKGSAHGKRLDGRSAELKYALLTPAHFALKQAQRLLSTLGCTLNDEFYAAVGDEALARNE